MKYKTEFYPEACCDYCGDIIHNHFDCPVCKHKYAETNFYHSMYDFNYEETTDKERTLECGRCGAKFILAPNQDWYGEYEFEMELINKKDGK